MILEALATFDATIGSFLRPVVSGSPALTVISVFLATYLTFLALAAMVVALVRVRHDAARRLTMTASYLRAAAAAAMGYAANAVIALVAFRPRPFIAFNVDPLIGAPLTTKSFPSDHATFAFAIAATLAYAYTPRRALLFVIAALIALGRVLAGVHYVTDIAAGAALGLFWAWVVETVDVRGGRAWSLRIARRLTRPR